MRPEISAGPVNQSKERTSAYQIVLIEDNPADVLLVELALQKYAVPYQLTTFENGHEALRTLCSPDEAEANTAVPDAILLDLNTPKSDGFNVLVRLKNTPHLSEVPVAIITSSQSPSDEARANLLGAVRYIQKPSQLEEFLASVGQAVKEILGAAESAKRDESSRK